MNTSNPDGSSIERYRAIRAEIADQQTNLAEAMRPFSEAINALSEQADLVVDAHMATVAGVDGIQVGTVIKSLDGRDSVVESFFHWLPIYEDNRLPDRDGIRVMMRAIKSNGKRGKRVFSCGLAELRFGNGIVSA